MKTLIGLVFVLFGSFPASAQSEQDQTVPATVQSEQGQTEQEVIVPVPVPAQTARGMTLTDMATVVGVTVGFLGFIAWIVNFIVSRSEGRINKKVDDAQTENKEAHDGITNRIGELEKKVDAKFEAGNKTLLAVHADIGEVKGQIKIWNDAHQNRSGDA